MDDFEPFPENGPKSIKKALGFSLKVDAVSPLRENAKFQWRYGVLAHAEKLLKIPYKTYRKLIILGPFSENVPKKHQKSIRFFTINHMAFRHVENPYKTCRI